MQRFALLFLVALFSLGGCERGSLSSEEGARPVTTTKVIVEPEKIEREREAPYAPEVKIKLRRDSKDQYSWEISGSDADHILKVNEKLRKRLTREPSP